MKTSPFKFLQEVRTETQKVTWPSRRETAITTAMVFIMVALAAVFFLIADQIIRIAVTFIIQSPSHFEQLNPIVVVAAGAGVVLLAFGAWALAGIRKGR